VEPKVYDVGGDSTVLPLIKQGVVEMTCPYCPYTPYKAAVEILHAARMGKLVKRYTSNDGYPVEDRRSSGDPLLFITKENVDEFREQGLSEY
jgi:hypothetical protein